MSEEFIERRIVTGLITSSDYIREVEPIWNIQYMESQMARTIAGWCFDFFLKYREAPGKSIEGIYMAKREALSDEQADSIAELLEDLSTRNEESPASLQYLADQTRVYFKQRSLQIHSKTIQGALASGDLSEAERAASSYAPLLEKDAGVIDPFLSAKRIERAFAEASEPLIKFPKDLGEFWNGELVQDSFVSLIGPEKRGKSFWLLDMAMRAATTGSKTILFQAGDMSEGQQLKRMCTYISGRHYNPKMCKAQFVPVLDCWHNQTDSCESKERECEWGLFHPGMDRKDVTYNLLLERTQAVKDYRPCHNCPRIKGTVALEWQKEVAPLTWKEAVRIGKSWREKHGDRLRLATYPNETLTISEIRTRLELLERQEGFAPDVIVIDYPDIMASDADCSRLDKLEQINKIWQRLRRISQERHCLVVAATQAAASSYDKDTIGMKDFSDNKKKHAHVTATYSLNQSLEEKKLGIMRLGKLVVREDKFNVEDQIHVIQHLHKGRAFAGSYL